MFREKFVEEVKYCQWFQDFVSDKDLSDIDEYRKNGIFASGVGDIIVDACVNVLCIPIVVISSIDNMAVTLHRSQLSQISSNPLYLACNAEGPGHYDGTKELKDIGDEIIKSKFLLSKKVEFFYLMKIIFSID